MLGLHLDKADYGQVALGDYSCNLKLAAWRQQDLRLLQWRKGAYVPCLPLSELYHKQCPRTGLTKELLILP
eukprot:5007147-Amphidinium_carterae.1